MTALPSSKPQVVISATGRIGRIILNRPEVLHALSTEMCGKITEALLAWRDDDHIEAVLITHEEGTRGFCGGGDVHALVRSVEGDGQAAKNFFAAEYRLNALIYSYPKPIVSLLDGVVMGGGVGISVHGAARVITERTIFAMPETGIGLFPDVGGGWFLPRLKNDSSGGLGSWLALTGTRLKGLDVLAAGVGTHFIESAQLASLTAEILALGITALDGLQPQAAPSFQAHLPSIRNIFTSDIIEEIWSKLEADGTDWSQRQLALMKKNCPLSMKVAHRQLREGATHRSFHETMRMEYRIANRLVRHPNFREGVRALLIDKDNQPRWSPEHLTQISDDMISEIFAPLDEGELTFLEGG